MHWSLPNQRRISHRIPKGVRYTKQLARRRKTFAGCILSVWLGMAAVAGGSLFAAEKPALTRLNPAGAQIGATSTIEATGSFKDWPVQIWCSNPAITWKCGEKAGTFEVQCPADASPMIAWVRFFNEAGTTSAKPILIVPQPVLNEVDPNDRVTQVDKLLEAGTVTFGVLDRTADVDHYKMELKGGQPFYAVVNAARALESPLDAHLQLLDSRGNVLTEDLDTYGYDPAIDYTPKRDGIYYLRVFGFPIATDSTIAFRGGGDWSYSLQWNTGTRPWAVHETNRFTEHLPTDAVHCSDIKAEAKDIPLNESFVQTIKGPKEPHYYRLPASHGKFFKFKSHSQSMGSPLDPVLSIIDSADKQVAQIDDISTTRDPELVWQMPAEGEFWLKVTDFHQQGGESHAYCLRAEELKPSIRGTTASELISGKATQEIEIAINLERIAGWVGELEITGSGLPEGSTITNNSASVTNDGPKTHSIKVQIPTAWQGPLNLSIKPKDEADESSSQINNTKDFACWLSIDANT